MKLITLIVHQQHLTLPNLINLTTDNGVHLVLVLLIERVMLQFQNLRGKGLTQIQDSTTAELLEVHLLTHLLTNLIVWLNFLCLAQGDFLILILHLTIGNHHTVTVNLKVPLVGVHNHIKVLIRTKHFGNHVTEAFFQHAYQCSTVDVLRLLEFLKGLNH